MIGKAKSVPLVNLHHIIRIFIVFVIKLGIKPVFLLKGMFRLLLTFGFAVKFIGYLRYFPVCLDKPSATYRAGVHIIFVMILIQTFNPNEITQIVDVAIEFSTFYIDGRCFTAIVFVIVVKYTMYFTILMSLIKKFSLFAFLVSFHLLI